MVSFASASATVVTRAIARFRAAHPGIRLSLTEAEPEEALPALRRGRFDVGVVYDFEIAPFGSDPDLAMTPVIDERMHLALPPDHRLAGREAAELAELAGESWLCGSSETSCRQLTLRSCERAGFVPDVAYESNDYTVMQALVSAGMGVTLIPDLALMLPSPEIALVEVVPDPPIRRVWAVTLDAGARKRRRAGDGRDARRGRPRARQPSSWPSSRTRRSRSSTSSTSTTSTSVRSSATRSTSTRTPTARKR